jgi:TonB family protein
MEIKSLMKVVMLAGATLYTLVALGQSHFPGRPQPVTTELPKYPSIARSACVQGTVGVLVTIDGTGKVNATDVLYGHPLLQRSAMDAARAWTFEAAKDDAGTRRELLRFGFRILPLATPVKKLKPLWSSPRDVEIRAHPPEGSCEDCCEKRRRELGRKMCS